MGVLKNWIYNDIVLYSKGWYQSSKGDLIEDLGYLFSQVYAWTPKTEGEVARMMLRVLDKLYSEGIIEFNSEGPNCYSRFFDEIGRDMSILNISFDRAIILYVKSRLFELTDKEIELNPPHYGKKEHFRLGSTFGDRNPISMTYKEMNRIVKKVFKNVE